MTYRASRCELTRQCDFLRGDSIDVHLVGNLRPAVHVIDQGIPTAACSRKCWRKFFDPHASNKSEIAQSALQYVAELYDIEREVQLLAPSERHKIRQTRSRQIADALHHG